MKTTARFIVKAEGPAFDGKRQATVEIDRERKLVTVRPFRRSTCYTLPLALVAQLIIWRCLRNEG